MAKRKNNSSWWVLLPLVVGVLVTPATLRMASIMALSGVDALTMLYPWVEVVKSPVLGGFADTAIPLAQWVMYLQFPVYGLMMSWLLRSRSFLTGLTAVIFLHIGGIAAAFLMGYLHNSPPTKIF
jgi:hypothetical protein